MRRKCRYNASLIKVKVALTAVQSGRKLAEAAHRHFDVRRTEIKQWKRQSVKAATEPFDKGVACGLGCRSPDRRVARLHAKRGECSMENELLETRAVQLMSSADLVENKGGSSVCYMG